MDYRLLYYMLKMLERFLDESDDDEFNAWLLDSDTYIGTLYNALPYVITMVEQKLNKR